MRRVSDLFGEKSIRESKGYLPCEKREEKPLQQHRAEQEPEEPQRSYVMPLVHGNEQSAILREPEGEGLYGYLSHAIYRLDNQTHQIVWKYACANDYPRSGGVIRYSIMVHCFPLTLLESLGWLAVPGRLAQECVLQPD